jgi:hypothetical protein
MDRALVRSCAKLIETGIIRRQQQSRSRRIVGDFLPLERHCRRKSERVSTLSDAQPTMKQVERENLAILDLLK